MCLTWRSRLFSWLRLIAGYVSGSPRGQQGWLRAGRWHGGWRRGRRSFLLRAAESDEAVANQRDEHRKERQEESEAQEPAQRGLEPIGYWLIRGRESVLFDLHLHLLLRKKRSA